jgi:nicotinamidase-related amidase
VQIVPELTPRDDEAVFDKLTMSAFDSTALGFGLNDCGVRALAIVGIALEIGIEPTARHAADNGCFARRHSRRSGPGSGIPRQRRRPSPSPGRASAPPGR